MKGYPLPNYPIHPLASNWLPTFDIRSRRYEYKIPSSRNYVIIIRFWFQCSSRSFEILYNSRNHSRDLIIGYIRADVTTLFRQQCLVVMRNLKITQEEHKCFPKHNQSKDSHTIVNSDAVCSRLPPTVQHTLYHASASVLPPPHEES